MDLDFTEEQQLLRNTARDFFEKEFPKTLVRELEEDPRGYSPELWKKMAELGWLGLIIPEQYGGVELGFMDLTTLLEEMGRGCAVGPFFSTAILGTLTILAAGSEEQKQDLLPKIANGELIMALALTEPSAVYDPAGITAAAVRDGDNYVLSGTKLFVHDAHIADIIISVARTKTLSKPEDGISLFLVDAKSPGISITPLETIAEDKQNEVIFDGVIVPATNLLGQENEGWPAMQRVLDQAAVAKCAEMVGGAEWALDATVAYAKERVQYDRPIGAYGSIQHYLADMWTQVGQAKRMTYYAAWAIEEGVPCGTEVASAKAWVNEAYKHVTRMGVQIHGGIGTTLDHDIGLYYRRARQAALLFGDTDSCYERVAQEMGL